MSDAIDQLRASALRGDIYDAREIAAAIRESWDLYRDGGRRERRAATLLLVLADEVERLRPELKPDLNE